MTGNPKDLRLTKVSKSFGSRWAVRDVNLRIKGGSFFSILGPSGCGKTTLLRMISGFMNPTFGNIQLGDISLVGVPPNKRPTALIFQNLALFPSMSVLDNISYGLRVRGIPRQRQYEVASAMLKLVSLEEYGDKNVEQLSGGQRQRVAIARALAVEPEVLLLDEPLSALDLKLRLRMRDELKAIQKRSGVTFVYITHDQGEAFAMSDQIALMSEGQIIQAGPPEEIYYEPNCAFAASFVGNTNFVNGVVRGTEENVVSLETSWGLLHGQYKGSVLSQGAAATLAVRPERVKVWVGDGPPIVSGAITNVYEGKVVETKFEGSYTTLSIRNVSGDVIKAHLENVRDAVGLIGKVVRAASLSNDCNLFQ